MLTHLSPSLRWIILLPASLLGGFVAGYSVYLINSAQAARPDAPIVYIADFIGSLVSNYVALYLAHEIAPSEKRTVVSVLIGVAVLASSAAVYYIFQHQQLKELIGVAGNLVGCYIAWKKFVRRQT